MFRAWLLWLGPAPLKPGERCTLRLGTAGVEVEVQSIDRAIDPGERGETETPDEVLLNGIAEVVLRSRAMLALDAFTDNPVTGRFLLADENEIVGAGLIGMEGYPDQRALITGRASNVALIDHGVSRAARARRNRHPGGVVWLTGLSGAGKSTLAIAAEDELFRKGYQVYALDGDNVRHGLNATLGFSPEDRAENIRRVGRGGGTFRRRRFHRPHGVHLALPLRSRAGACGGRAHRRGGLSRGSRPCAARSVRGARSEGALPAGAGR